LKPPFDIAADLDTPVSAYLKLKPFRPRFLLESVEGGERLARYSFIGFGDCLEVRLDNNGLRVGNRKLPVPRSSHELLDALRGALKQAPLPTPQIPGVPLLGGLVGVAGYDLVRYFEHLPSRHPVIDQVPDAHYLAPQSMLVFDHLTRSMALLHAGSEAERLSLRKEVIRALRGGIAANGKTASYSEPVASLNEAEYIQGVRRT
jgi:anthranilate synthase component 1